ncbi:MAG: hypothetical protein ACU4F9_06880 [Arcticibacter sp.]|jgi:hypothetical protein
MNKILQPRFLLLTSLSVLLYFVVMSYLTIVHEPEHVWIGTIRELTIIPLMLFLLLLMMVSLYAMWVHRRTFDLRLMGSVLLQAVTVFVMQNAESIFG